MFYKMLDIVINLWYNNSVEEYQAIFIPFSQGCSEFHKMLYALLIILQQLQLSERGIIMSKYIDLTGKTFGRLYVVSRLENDKHRKTRWLCQCSCPNKTELNVSGNCLLSENTKSCGCLRIENNRIVRISHGKSNSRIYKVWQSMKDRCYNKSCSDYKNYGGRGILICDEWLNNFQTFYDWAIINGYSEVLTIDRKDNDGNYEPSNCRFVDRDTQNKNRRKVFTKHLKKLPIQNNNLI